MPSQNDIRIFAAIDLGASSGRVVAGILDGSGLQLVEVHRFKTPQRDGGDYRRWDVLTAFDESLTGLRAVAALCAERGARFSGIGIDSWGVDYGLLSRGRVDLGDIRHHRDAGVTDDTRQRLRTTPNERYGATGILDQPINTSEQLMVRARDGSIPDESTVLFIPDIWIHLLTGNVGTDPTIASTSQLLDLRTGGWSDVVLAELGSGAPNMPPLNLAGSYAGATTASIAQRIEHPGPVPVFRVAGHDTASALGFAVPSRAGDSVQGIVSSGTWSVAGVASRLANATIESREAGFTIERGLRGFLTVRNLNGMWLLQECLRLWEERASITINLEQLLLDVACTPGQSDVIDVRAPELLAPADMPERIESMAIAAGRTRPHTRAEIVRVIIDSLAAAYVTSVDEAGELNGLEVESIRIVGGGSQNKVLCQATADRSGRLVFAGPAEATAVGNLVTQIWAAGVVDTIDDGYRLVAPTAWNTKVYHPSEKQVSA